MNMLSIVSAFFMLMLTAGAPKAPAHPKQATAPKPSAVPQPVAVKHGSSPSVSPDGARIAFLCDREGVSHVCVIAADGRGETQLTHFRESAGTPKWSTNGAQIYFSIFARDRSRIYAIDVDGKNQRQIGGVTGREEDLSPDRSRVICWTGSWTAMRLFVSTLDGSEVNPITDGSTIAWNTRWSPDGKRIAFTGRDAGGRLHVYLMNSDGSGRRQLTRIAPKEGQAQGPAWSPDGRQIAFQASSGIGHAGHLWIADVAAQTARKLAAHTQAYLDEVPAWFPDGKRLAFQSDRTGRMEIWAMNADGSGQRQVTR